MFKILSNLLIPIMLLSGQAGASRYPLTIKDCRGKSIRIPSEPKRIISLAPGNTEILFALGLDARIVGVTRYCNYPKAAAKKTQVGDQTTSIEKVISLKPDLVLAHGMVNDQAIESLEAHGIRVMAIDPKTLDQVAADILLVGKATNREAQAKKAAGRITSAKTLLKQKTKGIKARPKVLVAVQADPLWAAGPKTFVDEMIALAGGVNVASDAKPGFNQFSAEAAVWRNPDVIVGTYKGDRQVFTRGLWKDSKAAKAGRVYEADPDLLVRAGPRLADGLMALARLIQPNVFKDR